MSNTNLKPLAAAIGAAIVASLAGAATLDLDEDPFEARPLEPGYDLLADKHGGEGECGEGKCGDDKDNGDDDDDSGDDEEEQTE